MYLKNKLQEEEQINAGKKIKIIFMTTYFIFIILSNKKIVQSLLWNSVQIAPKCGRGYQIVENEINLENIKSDCVISKGTPLPICDSQVMFNNIHLCFGN